MRWVQYRLIYAGAVMQNKPSKSSQILWGRGLPLPLPRWGAWRASLSCTKRLQLHAETPTLETRGRHLDGDQRAGLQQQEQLTKRFGGPRVTRRPSLLTPALCLPARDTLVSLWAQGVWAQGRARPLQRHSGARALGFMKGLHVVSLQIPRRFPCRLRAGCRR